MKKTLLIIGLGILLSACGTGTTKGNETFNGSDFSFSYPEEFELKKAATTFVFENADKEPVLSMHRYISKDLDTIKEQFESVGQECSFGTGGVKYGGYKVVTVVSEGDCDLEGSMVTNKDGMFMLFVENNPEEANELKKALKQSFKFENN